jgi:prepilin-type N-terminal cleavage/methylation domain-containing protein
MKKILNKKNKGFTLVETLVAIAIFSTSILAVLSILSQGIIDTSYAKERVSASYLAQEGIEYIRNLRDTYMLYSATGQAGWNTFNTKVAGNTYPSGNTVCAAVNGCYFNADNLFSSFPDPNMPITNNARMTINACAGSCPSLLYDSATGNFGYTPTGTTANSGFIRKIQVKQISANETEIISTVFWNQGSGTDNLSFSESVFNWSSNYIGF